MQNKKLLTVVLAVVVVLVGVSIAFSLSARTPEAGSIASIQGAGPTVSNSQASVATEPNTATSSSTNSSSASSTPLVPVPVRPSQGPDGTVAPSASKAPATVASPSALPVEKPKLEVPAANKPKATTLPKSVERKPALVGTVPQDGSAKGKLVADFPTAAISIPEGAHIVDSSVSTQNRNVQASANFRTNMSQSKVLAFYESSASKKGWLATRGTNVDGALAITMGYGKDTVVATVRTAGTGATTVSVFGSFVVGK